MSSFWKFIFLSLLLQSLFQNIVVGQTNDDFINKQLNSIERSKVIKPFPHLENVSFQNLEEKIDLYAERMENEDKVYGRKLKNYIIYDVSKISDTNLVSQFAYIEITPMLDFHTCFKDRFGKVIGAAHKSNTNRLKEATLDYAVKIFNTCVDLRNSQQSVQLDYQTGKINFKDAVLLFEKNHEHQAKSLKQLLVQVNETLEDLKAGRPNRHAKINKFRESAKTDVVAQVLNYASGLKEDASGNIFFYPFNTENGRCEYKLYTDQGTVEGDIASQYAQAGKFLSQLGIPGVSEAASGLVDVVDLNNGNLQNVNFYNLQGAQRNKFTGVTAYLRYQSRVEGLPDMFECDSNSCNIDRLKRGWNLVASKCKGVTKAF
jgi:hypothetical protein